MEQLIFKEIKELKSRMSMVAQTKDLVDKLVDTETDNAKSVILPIWCQLPTVNEPLTNLIPNSLK